MNQGQHITIRTPGQFTPTLSLTALADLIIAVHPQLDQLGPWPALCGRELLHAIELWERDGKPWE